MPWWMVPVNNNATAAKRHRTCSSGSIAQQMRSGGTPAATTSPARPSS